MNATRLIEIARSLGELYQTKAKTALIQWQANQDMERIKLDLTPPDGWPGKNAEARDQARDLALRADKPYQDAVEQAATAHKALAEIEAAIQALETERRALEWEIRGRLVDALTAARVDSNHRGDPGGDVAFDDAADWQVVEQATDSIPF